MSNLQVSAAARLFVTLTQMPRPFRIIDFPRKTATGEPIGKLAVWPLNQDEIVRATIAAELLVRAELPNAKAGESAGYDIAFANASSVEQLVLACRDPDDITKPLFPSAAAIREHLTTDETGVLFSLCLDVWSELSPIVSAMNPDEADAHLDRLIEGGNEVDRLAFFSSEGLKTLVRTGVSRLRSFRTEPDSAGKPPESTDEDS